MNTFAARHALAPLCLCSLAALLAAQDGVPALPVPPMSSLTTTDGAYEISIVHVNAPGHPTNVVPGLGIPFRTGGASNSAFERPWISANGHHFAIKAFAAATTSNDEVLLLDGAVFLREGSPAPWAIAENVGPIAIDFAINDSGQLLFHNNTSPTTLDDYIVFFTGSTFLVLAKEGDPTPVGGTWSSTLDSTALTNSGAAFWRGALIAGLPAANNAVQVHYSGTQLRQKGVDVPLLQAGGTTFTWENFTANRLYTSPDGAIYVALGDTNGPTASDFVMTINDVVVIQEGSVLPGSSFVHPVSAIGKAWVDGAGNWYARGSNLTTGDDWLVRNGVLIAESSGSDEVIPGSGEFWDDATFATCFFCFDGNSLGQFVFGGVTSAPVVSNGVLVFQDATGYRRILVRESDPIDLDGNGLYDDDRFWNTFGDDDVLLLDDGTIYFTATLKNGAGVAVNHGLFKLTPRAASCTLSNGTGVNPLACTCATLPLLGSTWSIAVAPSANTVTTLLFASPLPAPFPIPLFGGEALIGVPAIGIPGFLNHPLPLPLQMRLLGLPLYVQGLRLEAVGATLDLELTNAQSAVIGF